MIIAKQPFLKKQLLSSKNTEKNGVYSAAVDGGGDDFDEEQLKSEREHKKGNRT